jgi:hypothetical protein
MRQTFIAMFALGLLMASADADAQGAEAVGSVEEPAEEGTASEAPAEESATADTEPGVTPWWEEEESGEVRGYIGAVLAAGIGVNGQIDTPGRAYVDTSVLFALRGGLLMGKDSRWMLGFEVAPLSNRLDWRLRATATGFISVGSLVPLKRHRNMAWLWKVGVGVGGGLDYRFLVAAQLDVLTFNYKMSDRLWIDFGIPAVRFHIETANQARWNTQIVFPLGITFAI